MAEREIVKLCRAKITRLGLSESKVVISEFRLLSCALMRGLASMILNRDLHCDQSRLKLLRVCKQNPIFACLPIHDMSLIFTAAALLSASGASSASNINLLCAHWALPRLRCAAPLPAGGRVRWADRQLPAAPPRPPRRLPPRGQPGAAGRRLRAPHLGQPPGECRSQCTGCS